jgi:hypothetical protein
VIQVASLDAVQWVQPLERSAPPSCPSQTRVLMVADATAFTRIPSYARLAARFVVNEVIPAIANEYGSLRRRGSGERAGAQLLA